MPARKAIGLISHIILLSLLFLFISSCGKIAFPVPDLPEGPRDYVWTVDTLSAPDNPFMFLLRIWGSDSDNVWAVGWGGRAGMWHYDGRHWTIFETNTFIEPYGIFGFSRDNTWLCTTSSSVWHSTDSKKWNLIWKQGLSDFPNIRYQDIWGPSPNEIYAVGYGEDATRKKFRTIISKYDGTAWRILNIPDAGVCFNFVRKQNKSGILLLSGNTFNNLNSSTYKVFSFDGLKLKELYTGDNPASMNDMNGEVYIDISRQIFKYKDGKLVVWKDFRNSCYEGRIWGRHENDFFFGAMDKGKYGIGHYNGKDMKIVFQSNPDFGAFEAVVFEKEAFFLGYDIENRKSLIVNGELKGE